MIYIFGNFFPIGNLISLWSRGVPIFQSRIQNYCYQILAVNTYEDKENEVTCASYLEKIDIKCNRSVLKEADSVNKVEKNLLLFEKSRILLKLNDSGVH